MKVAHRVSASRTKRGFDLALAAAAVVFLSPVLVLVAAAVKLESSGPVLHRHKRTGLNGKPFELYRFRATRDLHTSGVPTRAGRLLRWSGLDAMPSLLNILKGEMSFVGPRAFAPDHDHEFAEMLPLYTERFKACPGLIGLAEVRGLRPDIATRADLERRVACDIEYIETWSPGLDLATLARTLPLLFASDDAL